MKTDTSTDVAIVKLMSSKNLREYRIMVGNIANLISMNGLFPPHSSHEFDEFGRRVLVGLTPAETVELDHLDAKPPINKNGRCYLSWEANWQLFPASETRWLELYNKHLRAMKFEDRSQR